MPYALAIALDRQERATHLHNGEIEDTPYSAIDYIRQEVGLKVCTVALLEDLLKYLENTKDSALAPHLKRVQDYRAQYGAR